MRTYTIDEMKRAFECGRNFQLTAENNFQELIEELNQVNKISSNPMLVDSLPCSHQYSRSMNQPYPRKCVKCGKVKRQISTNDLQLNADFVLHKICDLGAVSS